MYVSNTISIFLNIDNSGKQDVCVCVHTHIHAENPLQKK